MLFTGFFLRGQSPALLLQAQLLLQLPLSLLFQRLVLVLHVQLWLLLAQLSRCCGLRGRRRTDPAAH
ncbi:hypothetical protein BXOR1_17455 [Xanthomonas oryzae pv. oryzicola]|nr:hypothetical protein ADT27_03485 [Xanthomonas oryzae]OLK86536.1 hypothetical protein BXOR1_17455 [Xanthomonas oryzae pv. oryzicola]OWB21244.1 hypothetical protein XocBAI15_16590 [Xanthomonas oryzae pv. oryzicola]OWB27405.1 hypothetical protein XocBAI21_15935 [Xanthomonas oryzae pv. oryzicola]